MSISAISSLIANQNIAGVQNQQKTQQQFQSLAQEFQSGDLATAQTNTLSEEMLPQDIGATAQTSSSNFATQSGGAHNDHRMRIGIDAKSDNASSSPTDELGQDLQSGNSASAVQAYNSLGQSLPQAGLSNELTAAEVGSQISTLSLTL